MAEPTPFALSQHFTDLVGRKVSFAQVLKVPLTKAKQLYGVYTVVPADFARVIQADMPLLGSFAGSLLGLPAPSIKERLAAAELDESMRDAIHEVLNIASTVISPDARAIFQKMYSDPAYFPDGATKAMSSPMFRSYFQVQVDGYEGGAFQIFAE